MNERIKKRAEVEPFSPLRLLYTAYTDERPVFTQAMSEWFQTLDDDLSPLSLEKQNMVFKTFCDIYTENERCAFLAGIRIGAQLMRELNLTET